MMTCPVSLGDPFSQSKYSLHPFAIQTVPTIFLLRFSMTGMACAPPIMANVFEDDPTSLDAFLLPELCELQL